VRDVDEPLDAGLSGEPGQPPRALHVDVLVVEVPAAGVNVISLFLAIFAYFGRQKSRLRKNWRFSRNPCYDPFFLPT
jgi:hypothetical protein